MAIFKNTSKKRYFLFLAVLFFVLLSFGYIASFNQLDPDFGWHLRTGQLILERGVPKIDWYSYTMPDFSWINHAWLTDVLIYKIHYFFGFQFLLISFLSIFTFAFILLIKRGSFSDFLFPIILGYLASLNFLGIRPQLFTFFLLPFFGKF